MKEILMTKVDAKQIYPYASEELKKELEGEFGKDFYFDDITDIIKTYEDAEKFLNIEPIDEYALIKCGFTRKEIALRKLRIVIDVLNERWKPNPSDKYEIQWFPGFIYKSENFKFDEAFCKGSLNLNTNFCFKDRDLAEYAGRQFVDLYKEIIL